ncbi:MAG: hypothetical protein IPO15_17550 [Anaerolineae bacterium]|nr:hypothetical protein [Anaerolineae bacterium]
MLPDLNGIEVANICVPRTEFVHLPIIMLSALAQVTDKIEGSRPAPTST